MDFAIKSGDTLPVLLVTLKDGAGAAVDVSSGTVAFRMRLVTAGPPAPAYAVNRAAAFNTDGHDGKVKIALTALETAVPGAYQGEFVVTFGSDQETFPSDGYISIQVSAKA